MSVWRRCDDEDDEEYVKEKRGLYILKNLAVIIMEYSTRFGGKQCE